MSDPIKHECGIVLLRLRKPLQYYIDKYGTPLYPLNKLYLLMEKQANRGQDGAGIGLVKLGLPPGYQYIGRIRSAETQPIADLFRKVHKAFRKGLEANPEGFYDESWAKQHIEYCGDLYLGHLRYGTHGVNSIETTHPFLRPNSWRSRNLMMAGNFNMTNVDELFNKLVALGQYPKDQGDTITVMEKIGHFLDEENQRQFAYFKDQYNNYEITEVIENTLDLQRILRRSVRDFDGGYAMVGLLGHGAAFVARDPNGIRPAYFYADDEVVVATSESPAIKTAFNVGYDQIREIPAGHALIVNKQGNYDLAQIADVLPKKSCSFERIYFSRGNNPEIYQERKTMGRLLTEQVLQAVDFDVKNTVFSYIPNTAETAFLGLVEGIEHGLLSHNVAMAQRGELGPHNATELFIRPRVEKLVIKDAKLRTFISDDSTREELVAHVYDTTYEVINKGKDTVVVIDDSIVRGTTLERSILTMLDKLEAKRVVIVSSAPQIRYPDCYGIDMSRLKEFVAFRAMIALLKQYGFEHMLEETYDRCMAAFEQGIATERNYLQDLYNLFTDEQISDKIAEIVTPSHMRSEVKVVYQTVENLHKACPNHAGDWYFTGNYPTPGGYKVVNRAFINFMQGKMARAY